VTFFSECDRNFSYLGKKQKSIVNDLLVILKTLVKKIFILQCVNTKASQ
jgi:hypothetical protein